VERERTYWNGEPAKCRRVVVVVGEAPVSTWWCARLRGTRRRAVEVRYAGHVFYLDDEDGTGWAKVTIGRGGPHWGHSSLPVERVVNEVTRGAC
jgi:hypothetical protein